MGTSTLGLFFLDVKKYPRLSLEEEKDTAANKDLAFRNLQNKLLSNPASWKLIFDIWNNVKNNKKASNKLTEEYGNIKFDARILTEQVEGNLSKAQNCVAMKEGNKVPQLIKDAGLSKQIYLNIAVNLVEEFPDIKNYLDWFYYYRDKLVKSNLLLVINFAKDFSIHGVSIEDLIQEGNLGIIRAAEKFDLNRGLKFSTYASWWIRQSFINLVKMQSKTIRLPSHIHNNLTTLKKEQEKFEYKYKREPTSKELSKITAIPAEMIDKLMETRIDPMSLETFVQSGAFKNGRQKQLKDLIGDTVDTEKDIIQGIFKGQMDEIIERILDVEEQLVIRHKFGIDTTEKSLEAIATILGTSKNKIKFILEVALSKLRKEIQGIGNEQ